jgi:ABC-type branched-subunit amino acid transport system substrate-binding protein
MLKLKYAIRTAAILAAGTLLGMAATPAAVQAAECTTKIGAVLPTSVDWGRPIARTAQFAAEIANKAGGVHGCKVQVILRDSQADAKVGVDAAKAMVDLDKVPVLLGAVSSSVTMPILTSVAVPANVMQISCCSSSTSFSRLAASGKTKGLWFRTFATTRIQTSMAALMAKEKGYKKIAIFYKNDDWGQDVVKLVESDFKSVGVTITAKVAITNGQPSYRAEVTSGLKGKPDAVYLALYPKEGIAVVREWISLGGTRKMIVANSLKSNEFRDKVGLKYLGQLIGTDTSAPRTKSAGDFVKLYKARFKAEPNGPGIANSFDAAMISLLAMQAAGKGANGAAIAAKVPMVTDPNGTPIEGSVAGFKKATALLKAGKPVSYQGATGAVKFDRNGDVSAPALIWTFTKTGIKELRYISLKEVDAFVSTLK